MLPAAPDYQHACGRTQGKLKKIDVATLPCAAAKHVSGKETLPRCHAALGKMSLPRSSQSKAMHAACKVNTTSSMLAGAYSRQFHVQIKHR